MNIKTFKGNFFEIGQQQGKIYKTNGMNFDKVKIDPVLYKNQLEVYKNTILNYWKNLGEWLKAEILMKKS